jgi:ubiquinone biosynthesis protein UbiJ
MSDGAQISIHDPRLSKLIGWGGSIAATLIGAGLLWVGSQLVGIRESLASMATTQREQNSSMANQITDLKAEVRYLRQTNEILSAKVASLEGKAMRSLGNGRDPFRD